MSVFRGRERRRGGPEGPEKLGDLVEKNLVNFHALSAPGAAQRDRKGKRDQLPAIESLPHPQVRAGSELGCG